MTKEKAEKLRSIGAKLNELSFNDDDWLASTMTKYLVTKAGATCEEAWFAYDSCLSEDKKEEAAKRADHALRLLVMSLDIDEMEKKEGVFGT